MLRKSFSVVLPLILCSCGFVPPDIKEPTDGNVPASNEHVSLSGTAVLEFEIEKKIFCELKDAVRNAINISDPGGDDLRHLKSEKNAFLNPDWIAEVSLSLQVDEQTAINPGVVLTQPLPGGLAGFGGAAPASAIQQSFGLGLGGTLSGTASTVDKFDPFWTVGFLSRKPQNDSICVDPRNDPILQAYAKENGGDIKSSPFLIDGKLGLEDWLKGALIIHDGLYSIGTASQVVGSPSGAHPDAITHEIKFVVVTSGNVTPTWKLVRVSANSGSTPFFGVSRTRTHDLIITIGPNKKQTDDTHQASLIGASVANAVMARTTQ